MKINVDVDDDNGDVYIDENYDDNVDDDNVDEITKFI